MLFVVSESLGRTQTVIKVARELSLNLSPFRDPASLRKQLKGASRRLLLVTESDLDQQGLKALTDTADSAPFGLIVVADREALRDSDRASIIDAVAELENVAWVPPEHDVDTLSQAARECRRNMLRVSRRELEEAIINSELLVKYQPKVERNDGYEWLTREAEALVRWRHPEHGLLGPLEFLPEVEEFNLIGPVSEYVLRETVQQLVLWREQGLKLNACINLASSLLSDPELPDLYARIVREKGLECASFTFEVAEQDVANSEAPHLRVLNRLRDLGFRISLDDFGVAASSLGTFEQLPFDEIKIHAAAVSRARENPVAQKVLAAVTGLAHKLGISVCAEGVEDPQTLEFLKTIECDKMQGFLISEAVMPDIIRRVYAPKQDATDEVA